MKDRVKNSMNEKGRKNINEESRYCVRYSC